MAEKVFTITELGRVASAGGAAAYLPTSVKFEWNSVNKAVPHNAWRMPTRLRTVRVDMPGAEEPTEQVLGWNYEPFTLSGLWDDRWLGAGGAYQMMKDFEEMVQRGAMVRLEFEKITMYGVITDFSPEYRREDYISYSFTVSPHFRKLLQTARVAPAVRTVDPKVAVETALANAKALEDIHADGGGAVDPNAKAKLKALVPNVPDKTRPAVPPFQLETSVLEDVGGFLDDIYQTVGDAMGTVQETVLDPLTEGSTSLVRLSQRFASLKSTAQNMITQLSSAGADVNMAYQTGVGLLSYETWSRGMAAQARLTWGDSHDFQTDLKRRAEPKAKAIYRPHKGESLYGISTRFYGTPHEWRRIMERNGLTDLTLQGSELLIIPEIT